MSTGATTAPWWDFPRTSVAAGQLVEAGRAHGLTDDQCLEGTGLTWAQVDARETIDAAQELAIARNLVRFLGDRPGLGFEVGVRYGVASLGVLGFALVSSATLREALQVGSRFFSLSHAFTRLVVVESSTGAVITFEDEQIPADVRRFFVERDLTAAARLLPFLFADELDTGRISIGLSFDESLGLDVRALLPEGVDVTLTGGPTTIVVPRSVLDAPLPQADPMTAELCRKQCSDLLEKHRRRIGIAAVVREILLRDPGAMPSVDRVAAELTVTGRTLERRLAADGTSYRALREEVLQTIARELLGSGLSVEAVGRRLGYSEVAAFSRAFKSWTGQPPSTVAPG